MIIVTGGAGFIGSNLVHLLNNGERRDIIIVDTIDSQKIKNIRFLDYYRIISPEQLYENMEELIDSAEVVFHLGAISSTTETDGDLIYRNNYDLSISLYESCKETNTPFIYASSASVYGDGARGFKELQPSDRPSKEKRSEAPLNLYAFSKYDFDRYVSNEDFGGFHCAGVRFFNVYGPNEAHKGVNSSVVYHFYNQAKDNGKIKVFEGSEEFLRDFIYVYDAVAVVLHLWMMEISGIYNCGTGEARSFMDIASMVANSFEKNVTIDTIPMPDHLKDQYQKFTASDNDNLIKNAGYAAEFQPIESGVGKYLNLLKKNGGFIK